MFNYKTSPITKQNGLRNSHTNLLDDCTTSPPPLPPRKIPVPRQNNPEDINDRSTETMDLMTFSDDNDDTNDSTSHCKVYTKTDVSNNTTSEYIPLNQGWNLIADDDYNKPRNELDSNTPVNIDKYLKDDLFKSCFDSTSEATPKRYVPHFNQCDESRRVVQSDNLVDFTEPTASLISSLSQSSKYDAIEDQLHSADSSSSVNYGIYKTEENTSTKTSGHPQGLPSETFVDFTESSAIRTNTESQCSSYDSSEKQSKTCRQSSAILNGYFRSNSMFKLEENTSTTTTGHPEESDTESEDQDYNCSLQNPSPQNMYLNKLRELEQEVSELVQLQKNWSKSKDNHSLNINRPRLSTQRSVSESDIYNSTAFEDNIVYQNITDGLDDVTSTKSLSRDDINRNTKQSRLNTTNNGLMASLSFENIRTMILRWRTKPGNTRDDKTSQKLSIKVSAQATLSCPCEKSCTRVERLVTTQGGFVWLSFYQCSWVSLYNHQHETVYKFDARGHVDSLAVSASGVLYVSCPPQKRILMLSSNLQMTVLATFNTLYPRGIAVSPYDGSLVVCMTSQHVGSVMDGPSKDSCLMKFKGETPNKYGKRLNKENHFGYPVKIIINKNGNLLVSDFGLNCLFVLDKEGNMLRTFSSLGGEPLRRKLALTSNSVNSFFVVQGGSGALSITRLGEYLGTFEEISTSTKEDPSIKTTVVTSSMNTKGKIVLASGDIITYVSLLYSK